MQLVGQMNTDTELKRKVQLRSIDELRRKGPHVSANALSALCKELKETSLPWTTITNAKLLEAKKT